MSEQSTTPQVTTTETRRRKPIGKIISWVLIVIILVLALTQYLNAARYEALVQVKEGNTVGVNPTGSRLDFGDLPKDKSAIRHVTLESKGNTAAYVWVWKRGSIGDLMKVSKNNFILEPGKTEKLEFSVYIPNSAEYKYYKGKVVIFKIPKFW